MAFTLAYTLDADSADVIKDFALDTAANYGTGYCLKGDLVLLSSGLLRKANATTTASGAFGVLEGGEFMGLVSQGQPYAAVNTSFTSQALNTTKYPNGIGKVRIDKTACVFKVPLKAGQTATNANIGVSYGLSVDANGDQTVDTTNTTYSLVKVIDFSADQKSVFVTVN